LGRDARRNLWIIDDVSTRKRIVAPIPVSPPRPGIVPAIGFNCVEN